MIWTFKHFKELSLDEFHDLLSLRIKVFVVEQDCPYQELDGKDKVAYHLIGKTKDGKLVGTLRVLPPGVSYEEVAIGRIVIDPSHRNKSKGSEMMDETMNFIRKKFGDVQVRISAQEHLEQFYNNHNFYSTEKKYLEDGIPHIEMLYKPKN